MTRILKIGMDVHTTNYTLCVFEPSFTGNNQVHYQTQVKPEVKNIIDVINNLKEKFKDEDLDITCGYEAGCLGYSLYNQLKDKGIKCIILAPSTMATPKGGKKVKNDFRDSKQIAECLAFGGYKEVYVPTAFDNSVKEYIRMRGDIKANFKSIKQQIIALCTREGFIYSDSTYWTTRHISWLNSLSFTEAITQETLREYLIEYDHLESRLEQFDKRIEEIAEMDVYRDKVNRLKCLRGIKTFTALALIVETSDFTRFKKGNYFGAWIGLIPGQEASAEKDIHLGITKAGNRFLRILLVEAAQSFTKGAIGYKSRDLKQRQLKCSTDVIAYADKANERLQKKYYKMIQKGKKFNVAKCAIARELACFIWGIMTDNIALTKIGETLANTPIVNA